MNNKTTCPKCGEKIDIDDLLARDIEARVVGEERAKHEAEVAKVRAEATAAADETLRQKLEIETKKREQDFELQVEKMRVELDGKAKKEAQGRDLEIKKLRDDATAEREQRQKIQEQLSELLDQNRELKNAKDGAEIEAKKKMAAEEDKIREQVKKEADEAHRLREEELKKQLADVQKDLDQAQRRTEKGSQQNQGEVLELMIEEELRKSFIGDEITEIKKGANGADIQQIVRNKMLNKCGVILWECKNTRVTPAMIPKLKNDMRVAAANIGVIVSPELEADMKNVEDGVWVVKPSVAIGLAYALRFGILETDRAHRNNENKDEKMEYLYKFLTGPEFRHRIQAIVDNYKKLMSEHDTEKRTTQQRWARQEKSLAMMMENTVGVYGDLQGIAGASMLELEAGEDDT
jgi:hypothetical protein